MCACAFVCKYLSGVLPQDDAPTMVEILRILNLRCKVTKELTFENFYLSRVLPEDKHASNGLVRKHPPQHTATHCNTLQHATIHCITLQHTATHGNTLRHTTTPYNTDQSGVLPEDKRAGNRLVRKAPPRLQRPVAHFDRKYLQHTHTHAHKHTHTHPITDSPTHTNALHVNTQLECIHTQLECPVAHFARRYLEEHTHTYTRTHSITLSPPHSHKCITFTHTTATPSRTFCP